MERNYGSLCSFCYQLKYFKDFESFNAENQAKSNEQYNPQDAKTVITKFLGHNRFIFYPNHDPIQVLVGDKKSAERIRSAQEENFLLNITPELLSIFSMQRNEQCQQNLMT